MSQKAQTYTIIHPVYGQYTQIVYETTEEAQYRPLSSGENGWWEMPTDPATTQFVSQTKDKIVFEVGSGPGGRVVLPSLKQGAKLIYATDITTEYFSEMAQGAKELGRAGALRTRLLKEDWWHQKLQDKPTVSSILGLPPKKTKHPYEADSLPDDGTVDLMIARHCVHFGDPRAFLRFLDLASVALKPGGTLTCINFTPYTGYMYGHDNRKTLEEIIQLNEAFACGKRKEPGGILNSKRGDIPVATLKGVTLTELTKQENLSSKAFLYFDRPTLAGLLRLWKKERVRRALPMDLQLVHDLYFTPPLIASFNKLAEGPAEWREQENHVFLLRKFG